LHFFDQEIAALAQFSRLTTKLTACRRGHARARNHLQAGAVERRVRPQMGEHYEMLRRSE
jgi:hypothetical protein